ncbi:glycosyltransferase [Pontibacter sp. H249]|uniref:glycosyltransferase n=1 Tax=Pontibacter sp. H249 TaxID=3133420 RepID=UPI0030BF40F7
MLAYQEKIVFIIHRVGLGGAELFLKTIVNNFAGRGIKPVLVLLSEDNPILNEFSPEIKVIVAPRRYRYDLSVSRKIRDIVIKEEARKVFCIGAFTFFLAKLRLMLHANVTFYLSLHTTVPFSVKNHLLDTLYLKFLGKNDVVIFICKNQKEYYKKKYLFNMKRSHVIYNGIDTVYFCPDDLACADKRNIIRCLYNIPPEDKVILNVANIRPEKGQVYAIEALSILHNQFSLKAHLMIVGDAMQEDHEKLVAYIEQFNLIGYVHFAGMQKDVRPYLAAADAFTLTSYSETFSLAALEAMSFGLPCVLTNTGGAAEMIVEPKNGLLSKARDAYSIANCWEKILVSKLDTSYIMQFAHQNFSSEQMVDNYFQVLSG